MQKYELILLLNYQSQESDRLNLLSDFEKKFKDNVVKKDDMWLQQMHHEMHAKRWNDKAYFVSYYIKSDNSSLKEIKKYFLYANVVVRYNIFKMNQNQEIFEFEKLQKELEKIMDSWDTKRFWNRISFLSHQENIKYINWKSIIILKKYLTRFGSIKPRKYTKNNVKIQKKLRRAIIRARSLWLLEFVRK